MLRPSEAEFPHSRWSSGASPRRSIIGIIIIVTIIIAVIGAITVAIAGGVTDIATAVGGEENRVNDWER